MPEENILTSPNQQNLRLKFPEARTVPLTAGQWTQIVGTDPRRLTLTVWPTVSSSDLYLSPAAVGTPPAKPIAQDTLPVVIHSSVFPLLIQGVWWAFSQFGQPIIVWDTTYDEEG